MKELSIEEKELLLKDLSARLPYDVCVHIRYKEGEPCYGKLTPRDIQWFIDSNIEVIKPYLRSMSSMTEEEKEELLNRLPKYWSLEIDKLGDLYFDICDASYPDIELLTDIIDWLNKHHFDYRGLIEKGLALEATEDMYNN